MHRQLDLTRVPMPVPPHTQDCAYQRAPPPKAEASSSCPRLGVLAAMNPPPGMDPEVMRRAERRRVCGELRANCAAASFSSSILVLLLLLSRMSSSSVRYSDFFSFTMPLVYVLYANCLLLFELRFPLPPPPPPPPLHPIIAVMFLIGLLCLNLLNLLLLLCLSSSSASSADIVTVSGSLRVLLICAIPCAIHCLTLSETVRPLPPPRALPPVPADVFLLCLNLLIVRVLRIILVLILLLRILLLRVNPDSPADIPSVIFRFLRHLHLLLYVLPIVLLSVRLLRVDLSLLLPLRVHKLPRNLLASLFRLLSLTISLLLGLIFLLLLQYICILFYLRLHILLLVILVLVLLHIGDLFLDCRRISPLLHHLHH